MTQLSGIGGPTIQGAGVGNSTNNNNSSTLSDVNLISGIKTNRFRTALLNLDDTSAIQVNGDSFMCASFKRVKQSSESQYLDRLIIGTDDRLKRNYVVDTLIQTTLADPIGNFYINQLDPNNTYTFEKDKWFRLLKDGVVNNAFFNYNIANKSKSIRDGGVFNLNLNLANNTEPFNTFRELTKSDVGARPIVGATLLLAISNLNEAINA